MRKTKWATHKFSKQAQAKIEAAGGTVEVVTERHAR